MRFSGNPVPGKKRKKLLLYWLAVLILLAVFFVSRLMGRSSDRARLEEIKKEKEIGVVLYEKGYPGDDPYAAPGKEWELHEGDGELFWYNPDTAAKLIPVMEDGTETVSFWFYEDSQGKRYRLDRDETYRKEE